MEGGRRKVVGGRKGEMLRKEDGKEGGRGEGRKRREEKEGFTLPGVRRGPPKQDTNMYIPLAVAS